MKTVVITPTYNEAANIGKLVPAIFAALPSVSIVVVDDNSPDGTGSAVISLKKIYPRLELMSRNGKEGLGKAYTDAFRKVIADDSVGAVVMMDADLSHQPSYLPEMLAKSEVYSVVIGSRYVAGGGTVGWELWRRMLSYWANFYCRTITRMPIKDCTGGFVVIHADLLRKIDFSKVAMSGYAFIMELKYLLYRAGGTFFEVPITFTNRMGGESKISVRIIIEGILAPWKILLKKNTG